jgi:hypothetical protein
VKATTIQDLGDFGVEVVAEELDLHERLQERQARAFLASQLAASCISNLQHLAKYIIKLIS